MSAATVALGARVTATASANDRAFVTGLGATTVIDYAAQRFEDHIADVDVVLDLVGGQTQTRSWRVLRPGGTLVGIAAAPSPTDAKRHGTRYRALEHEHPGGKIIISVSPRQRH